MQRRGRTTKRKPPLSFFNDNNMDKTIEKKTADTLLQKPVQVTISGKTYTANQPTIATLVMASEKIAELPTVELDRDNIVNETFAIAPHGRLIAETIAILLLGAKRIRAQKKSIKQRVLSLFGFETDNEYDRLVDELFYEATPSQLNKALAECVMSMQIGDFFGLTTTLLGINLTKAKMRKATASGR